MEHRENVHTVGTADGSGSDFDDCRVRMLQILSRAIPVNGFPLTDVVANIIWDFDQLLRVWGLGGSVSEKGTHACCIFG